MTILIRKLKSYSALCEYAEGSGKSDFLQKNFADIVGFKRLTEINSQPSISFDPVNKPNEKKPNEQYEIYLKKETLNDTAKFIKEVIDELEEKCNGSGKYINTLSVLFDNIGEMSSTSEARIIYDSFVKKYNWDSVASKNTKKLQKDIGSYKKRGEEKWNDIHNTLKHFIITYISNSKDQSYNYQEAVTIISDAAKDKSNHYPYTFESLVVIYCLLEKCSFFNNTNKDDRALLKLVKSKRDLNRTERINSLNYAIQFVDELYKYNNDNKSSATNDEFQKARKTLEEFKKQLEESLKIQTADDTTDNEQSPDRSSTEKPSKQDFFKRLIDRLFHKNNNSNEQPQNEAETTVYQPSEPVTDNNADTKTVDKAFRQKLNTIVYFIFAIIIGCLISAAVSIVGIIIIKVYVQ